MDYHILREFADSWMLLFLFLFFVGVVIWVFRPGSTRIYQDPANIPFRHENAPAPLEGDDTSALDRAGAAPKEAQS